MNKFITRFIITLFITLMCIGKLEAAEIYSSEILFTLPWGNNVDEISLWWKYPTGLPSPEYEEWVDGPQPSSISANGGFVICSYIGYDNPVMSKYAINGSFINRFNFLDADLCFPDEICINDNGCVLLLQQPFLTLFDNNLNEIEITPELCLPAKSISKIYSAYDGFWCLYTAGSKWENFNNDCSAYLIHISFLSKINFSKNVL